MASDGLIPIHGNYKDLASYRKAELVYDITFRFCQRFLRIGDRTVDQMVQAARSGKQNIVEGTAASGTSKEMEIKLIGVARASLEELLNDYKDFLRVRDLPLWDKESKEARYARRMGDGSNGADVSYERFREVVATRDAAVVANVAICLVHQANYLLDRQLRSLEKAFVNEGGLRERMTRARIDRRKRRE